MIPVWAKLIALGIAAYEGTFFLQETGERREYQKLARRYCDEVGKPMLQIGIPERPWEYTLADVYLDINPEVENYPGGMVADERAIPFPDKHFGACYNSHTLEHLATADDIQQAVNECCRVADQAIFLCPSPHRIASVLHPGHRFRVFFRENNQIAVRRLRYAMQAGQAIITPQDQVPEVIEL